MKDPQALDEWIHPVSPELKNLDSIPLTGAVAPFKWEELAKRLSQTFERDELTIQPGEIKWRTKEDLYEEIGTESFVSTFSIPKIAGEISLVVPKQIAEELSSFILTTDSTLLSNTGLVESFYRFFSLELLHQFNQTFNNKALMGVLTKHTDLPMKEALSWDISLNWKKHTFHGRLLISPEFRKGWVDYFEKHPQSTPLKKKIAEAINVEIELEIGRIGLSLAEWQKVKTGDFIIINTCSLNPVTLEGPIQLTVKGRPVFNAEFKKGKIKILERPQLYEVETPMAKNFEDEDEDELSDFDLDDFDSDDDLFNDTEHEDDLTDDLTDSNTHVDENEESLAETEEQSEMESEELEQSEEETQAPVQSVEMIKSAPIKPEDIPLSVIVEMGKIQLSIAQMLKLEPGNLLEVHSNPEKTVDLTVNGNLIGKGELIRIGDVIGVRILDLGQE